MKRLSPGHRSRSSHRQRLPAYLLVALPVLVVAVLLARGRAPIENPVAQPTPTIIVALATTPRGTSTVVLIPPPTAAPAATHLPTLSATGSPSPTSTLAPSPTETLAPSPAATSTRAPTATPMPVPPTATDVATLTPRPPTPTSIATAQPSIPTAPPSGVQRTVAVDPGHGGVYAGAVHTDANGAADVVEKQVNLRVGLLLADMLHEAGYRVVMTRATDTIVNTPEQDQNGDGKVTVEDDLQARVDLINASGADLLVSIHHNGSDSPMRGTTTYYCASRPFTDRNRSFAAAAHAAILSRLREAGYASPVDLGVRDDATLGKPGGHLCLTGPTMPGMLARASLMPGLVGEALFVSDDQDAALLRDNRFLQAIAAGYRDGVLAYFAAYP
jgi:N-acetylmuramoyl-L-alanine amidase